VTTGDALPGPVSRASAAHYAWGDACDGWPLVRAAGVGVTEERMPPGAAEARHRHARSRQFFYVLDGVMTIEVEGTVHALRAGTGLEIPPGAAHQPRNDGEHDLAFLVVSAPPTDGDREPAPGTDLARA
jgi:mannose-6-phosphate isomerase-like protein (cupin superfamily)